jgi:hypothetical protein
MPFCKQAHIIGEVGQQNVLAKVFQFLSRIPREPVLNDFIFCIHNGSCSDKISDYFAGMITPVFPSYPFQIKNLPEGTQIFCEIRRRWVKLTPEEWVRQNIFQWMKQTLRYPKEMISLEKGIMVGEMSKRYDLLVYDQQFNPWMLVECKAQSVTLTEETLMQVLRYHIAIPVPYLCITNGDAVMVFEKIDGRLEFLAEMPLWKKGER